MEELKIKGAVGLKGTTRGLRLFPEDLEEMMVPAVLIGDNHLAHFHETDNRTLSVSVYAEDEFDR